MKKTPEVEAVSLEPEVQAVETHPVAAPEPTPLTAVEPKEKEYIVKPGCAIEHAGVRYEGNAENPVKVSLSASDAEVHAANLA